MEKDKINRPDKCECDAPTLLIDKVHLEKYPQFKELCIQCGGKLKDREGGIVVMKRGHLDVKKW